MKKNLTAIFICIVFPALVHAQRNIKEFKIILPEGKVASSVYGSIAFLDSRENKHDLGMVQLGLLNKPVFVQPQEPLEDYIHQIFQSLKPSTAGNEQLLLQLRNFAFTEKTGFSSEHGYLYFRAALYKDSLEKYYLISSIDTIADVKAMDVTQKILKKGSAMLVDFMAAGMSESCSQPDVAFTHEQLLHIDDIEKSSIPLYTATVLKDGVYNDFNAFKNQEPDEQIEEVKMKSDVPQAVFITDKKGKRKKVFSGMIYAFVQNNVPYIATDYGYYPLIKKGNDFIFTGKVKTLAHNNEIATASLFFGLAGYAIASSGAKDVLDMKVDHLTGAFIPLDSVD